MKDTTSDVKLHTESRSYAMNRNSLGINKIAHSKEQDIKKVSKYNIYIPLSSFPFRLSNGQH